MAQIGISSSPTNTKIGGGYQQIDGVVGGGAKGPGFLGAQNSGFLGALKNLLEYVNDYAMSKAIPGLNYDKIYNTPRVSNSVSNSVSNTSGWIETGGAQSQAYIPYKETITPYKETITPKKDEGDGVEDDEVSRTISTNYITSAPVAPDLLQGLDADTLARLSNEANLSAQTEFGSAINTAEKNIVKSNEYAELERNMTKPAYEEAMRNTAAVVANSVADWAQSLNAIGRYQGGQYGGGQAKIIASGNQDRANLEIALNKRLDDITTRAANYERDTRDYIAGLRREQGLKETLYRHQLVREELQRQTNARQQMFTNEMERANFVNNMNQVIWAQEMQERQFLLQSQAQQLENQLLLSKIKASTRTGTTTPKAPDISEVMAELYSGTPWGLVQQKIIELNGNPDSYARAVQMAQANGQLTVDQYGDPINTGRTQYIIGDGSNGGIGAVPIGVRTSY